MDHHRARFRPLGRDVAEVEAFGQHEVELNRRQLPLAAQRVEHDEVDLRSVERAVSGVDFVADLVGLQRAGERGLGPVPGIVVAQALVGPRGEIETDLLEAEGAVHLVDHPQDRPDFAFDLFRRAEDVGVVLRERPDARQAGQHARTLEAVQAGEVGIAQRQIAVRVFPGRIHVRVAGAIHRLDAEVAAFHLGEIDVFLVVLVMAGTLPDVDVENLRRDDLLIAVALVQIPDIGDEQVVHHGALGVEERAARRHRVEAEQVEFLAQPAVVAAFGFFDEGQVPAQFLGGGERRTVHPLQHLVVFVAAPVRAGHAGQLERRNPPGRRHVRAAAQVDELALPVEREDFVFGDALDDLGLVGFAHLAEQTHRVVARYLLADDRQILFDDCRHLGFDPLQILRRERPLVREVVIEPVFDDRPDRDLHARE